MTESGPNSMDIHGVGANRPSYQASWNLYDRLLTYGVKTLPDGSKMYDYSVLKPELAESWQVAPDGMSVTLKLRRDAKFHDGTPVTAKDVKWSFDRAVTVGGFPTFQMKAGSLEKPEQFVVVDDVTFRINFLRKDRLTLPDIAVPVPVIINSELAKKHATASDPWAMEWLKNNDAGGGAFKLESWKPGQESVFIRFDDWKSGPLPKLKKVIVREVPSAGNRRALLERGDADISFDLPPKDFDEMAKAGKLKVVGIPVENAHVLCRHEREDPALRQREGAPGRRVRDPVRQDHGRRHLWAGASSSTAARLRRIRMRRRPGPSPSRTRPTSPRPRRSSPRRACRTASRPRINKVPGRAGGARCSRRTCRISEVRRLG